MEFKLTANEVRELADLEASADCDIEAGFDWGSNLGTYLAQALNSVDHGELLEVLQKSLGNVLSQEELEEAVHDIQEQLRNQVIRKIQSGASHFRKNTTSAT